jgi:hypothetical protein
MIAHHRIIGEYIAGVNIDCFTVRAVFYDAHAFGVVCITGGDTVATGGVHGFGEPVFVVPEKDALEIFCGVVKGYHVGVGGVTVL